MSNPIAQPTPPNRLTIGFLMLWTLGTALILACYRAFDDSPPPTALALATSFYLLTYALVNGLAIAGVLLFIQRQTAKVGGLPTQPGHWLLLVRGFSTFAWLAGWISRIVIERYSAANHFTPPMYFSSLYLLIQYLPAAAVGFAGITIALRRNKEAGRPWRFTFRLLQANAALGLFISVVMLVISPFNSPMLPYMFTTCLYPVIFIALIVALATDRDMKSRDFLHWAGGLSAIATTTLPFLYRLLARLL